MDLESWLLEYYRKVHTNVTWWANRRDTLTYWSLSLVLGTVAAYAAFYSPNIQVPALYRLVLLAASIALVYRFFMFTVIAYAWLRKFVTLRDQLERYVFAKNVDFEAIRKLVTDLDHSRYTTVATSKLIKDQMLSGHWLILGIPTLLFIIEIAQMRSPLAPIVVLILVFILIGESGYLLSYTPIMKHPNLKQILAA